MAGCNGGFWRFGIGDSGNGFNPAYQGRKEVARELAWQAEVTGRAVAVIVAVNKMWL